MRGLETKSQDGQPNVWSAGELSDILAIWRAVSEDYSAFDVDVTTEDPGAALATSGTRVVIGGSGTACECASACDTLRVAASLPYAALCVLPGTCQFTFLPSLHALLQCSVV